MRLKRWILTFLLLAFACTPDKIQKLEITRIGDVHLRSVTSKTLSLDVEIFLRNPYFKTARVRKLSFEIAINTGFFGKGYVHEPFEIESGATRALVIPVVVECDRVTKEDYLTLFAGKIPYHFQGTLDLEKPVRAEKVTLDARGTVKRPEPLQVLLEHKTTLSIVSLEDSSIRELLHLIRKGKITLQIRNPFSFPIHTDGMNYEIGLGKAVIAEGSSSEPAILDPGVNHLTVSASPRPIGAAEGLLRGILDQRVPKLNLTARVDLKHENQTLAVQLKYLP